MNNQRINILRDELEQRRDEILQFNMDKTKDIMDTIPQNISNGFFQKVAELVLFFHLSPEYKDAFRKLVLWSKTQLASTEVRTILDEIRKIMEELANEVLKLDILDSEQLGLKESIYRNPFDMHSKSLTAREFISKLTEPFEYGDEPIDAIQRVVESLRIILRKFHSLDNEVKKKLWIFHGKLDAALGNIESQLEFRSKYEGCEDAKFLYSIYVSQYPDREIKNSFIDSTVLYLEGIKHQGVPFQRYTFTNFVKKCQKSSARISKILSRALAANQLKNYTITRLKSYMEWFYNSRRIRRKTWRENQLTEEMAKFLFAQGFFPFIRFKAGQAEPDMVALSTHEEIIIEAKNYLIVDKPTKNHLKRKKLTSKKINYHISQAIQYYDKVRSLKKEMDNQIYLVIFYNGDFYPVCTENIIKNGVFVNITFIYLGKKTPHEKRQPLVLEIDDRRAT